MASGDRITAIRKCRESERGKVAKLHRFGPHYPDNEDEVLGRMRDEALQHVIAETGGCPLEAEENLLTAVGGGVEQQARDAYGSDEPEVADLQGADFRRLMVKQGCLFLLMTLAILGADADQRNNAVNNLILGRNLSEDHLKSRLKLFYRSMVFPGNQIPLVVLNKLMEQAFFKDKLAAKTRWDKPEIDSLSFVLHELVLVPALKRTHDHQQGGWMKWLLSVQQFCCNKISGIRTSCRPPPVDILHGLYLQLVGPGEGAQDEPVDLVWEELESHGSQTGAITISVAENQEIRRVDTAQDLHQVGIRFKGIKGLGIRQIHLKQSIIFGATLCLPSFNEDTLSVLCYLQDYEDIQELGERDVTAYVRFLSDTVRTPGDAFVLSSQGVFQDEPQLLNRVPDLLEVLARRTASNRNSGRITSKNLDRVRADIEKYRQRPRYGKYFGLIGILTFVGALFSVLQYFKKNGN